MTTKCKSDVLKDEVISAEAYVCGICWNNPSLYIQYSADKLGIKHFGNAAWKFYFGLGRHLQKKGLSVFDDISVANAVMELKQMDKYQRFGGYDTIEEIMDEIKGKESNFEAYMQDVKKYSTLRGLRDVLGEQVIQSTKEYNYLLMTKKEIQDYWSKKINDIALDNSDSPFTAYDLTSGLKEFIAQLDENPDTGMELYNCPLFNDIANGWANATLNLISSFSGNGKSSFMVFSCVMGCILAKEKLLIIANEMDVAQYKKYLLITIMGNQMYALFRKECKNARFNRKNLNKGNFTEEERKQLEKAVSWIETHLEDQMDLIKFVPLESYTMDNVEEVIRYHHRLGYNKVIIDTAKPTESRGDKARWEQFVDDFERLYKLVRKDEGSGGLGVGIFCTVQAADTAINTRYLNETSIADGKKIKNVCDTVYHFRPIFQDEFSGGKNELKILNSQREVIRLDPKKVYYLVFVSKNRRGQSNLTNLNQLVFEVDLNSNRWMEVGWTVVTRDFV